MAKFDKSIVNGKTLVGERLGVGYHQHGTCVYWGTLRLETIQPQSPVLGFVAIGTSGRCKFSFILGLSGGDVTARRRG